MSKKHLFNFYLDDNVKDDVVAKLCRLNKSQPKGQVAALIRVLLQYFLALPDDSDKCKLIAESVASEYEYSATKNKRSNL